MPELPLDMTPGGNVIRLPTAADVSTGRSADLPSAGGGFNAKEFSKALLMGLSTIDFTGEGKTNPQAALKMLELDRLEKVEARKAEVEERKLTLEKLKTFSALRKDQFDIGKNALAGIIDFSKNSPAATDAERSAAAESFRAQAEKAGVPLASEIFHGIVRNPRLRDVAGDLLPYLEDSKVLGVSQMVIANAIRSSKPEEAIAGLEKLGLPAVTQDLFAVVPKFAPLAASLPPEQQFAALVNAISAIPERGPAMATALRGGFGQSEEMYKRLLDVVVTPTGITRPDVMAAATAADATTTATELAKTKPAVTAGKAKQEDVLRAGKAATAGAEEAARLEAREGVRMPSLETRTLAVLAEQKLDPRKASTEQLQAARKEGDQRALQFEKQKEEMKAKVALGKPLTADQTNDLRLAYRREARSVVLSTEPGGIFGAVEKLEPAQKQALENRIDAKATEMATADGFPSLFARKAVSPAKSGDKGRAAAASDVQKALQDAKGDRARARELLIRRGFDPARSLRE